MKFSSQHSLSASDRVRLDTRCQRRLAIQTFDISLAFLMNKIRDNSFEQKKKERKKGLFWLCVDDKSGTIILFQDLHFQPFESTAGMYISLLSLYLYL